MPQANLSKGFPFCVHDADLGVEVLEVGGVRETIFNVNLGIYQRSIPESGVLVARVETIDQTRAESGSKQEEWVRDEGMVKTHVV